MVLYENNPQISVLIPTFNQTEKLRKTVDKIAGQTYPKDKIEIIIFNDGNKEDTVKKIKQILEYYKNFNFSKVELINNKENVGISVARNLLIKKISVNTRYLFFLDDDVYISKDTIEVLEKYISKDNSIGIIAPRTVLVKNRKTIQSANFINNFTGKYISLDSDEIVECDFVDPLCMLVRRDIVEKIDGFNEKYYRSHEGVDFCLRAKKLGYKIVYNPYVVVEHDIESNTNTGIRLYYLYRNKIFIIKEHLPLFGKILGIFIIIILGLPFYIFSSVKENKRFCYTEIKLILEAIIDGVMGKNGKKI